MCPCEGWVCIWGNAHSLLTSALAGPWVVTFTNCRFIRGETFPNTHWVDGCGEGVSPELVSTIVIKKNLLPLPENNLFFVQHVACLLYRNAHLRSLTSAVSVTVYQAKRLLQQELNLGFVHLFPFFHDATAHSGLGPPQYPVFTITLRHTTLGRTPLGECSAWRRDHYLTTRNIHKRQTSMPPAGFEPATPASERPQTAPPLGSATNFHSNVWLLHDGRDIFCR
jgi:hypothetical protein